MAIGAACVLSASVHADCVRWVPPPPTPNAYPDFDGPGSFGALQDTVTLDCLTYVGSIHKNGEEFVFIRDERGKVHRLKRGHFMGENGGRISRIDENFIYLNQAIRENDQWVEKVVMFPKRTDKR